MDVRSLPLQISDAPLHLALQQDSIWSRYRWIAVLLPFCEETKVS